jgi:hypothetical protein
MKKKIIAVALSVLCIFILLAIRNFGCSAKSRPSSGQASGFQTTLMLCFINGNTSIMPSGPGSGGGRGPSNNVL